jgi:phage gp36-like protein
MSYISAEYIEDRISSTILKELTDANNTTVDYDIIDKLIIDTEVFVNSMLNSIYTLPLSFNHDLITLICFKIFQYNLYRNRYNNEMPESILNEYHEAKSLLNKITSLDIELSGESKKSNNVLMKVSSRTSRINTGWFKL